MPPQRLTNRLPSRKVLKALSVALATPYGLAMYQLLIVPSVPTFDRIRPVNLIPGLGLVHLLGGEGGVPHKAFVILGNALVFVPFGMLLGLWFTKANRITMLVIGVFVPVAFETYQYLAPTWRMANVDAAILGAIGCCGAAIVTRRVADALAPNPIQTKTQPDNKTWV